MCVCVCVCVCVLIMFILTRVQCTNVYTQCYRVIYVRTRRRRARLIVGPITGAVSSGSPVPGSMSSTLYPFVIVWILYTIISYSRWTYIIFPVHRKCSVRGQISFLPEGKLH